MCCSHNRGPDLCTVTRKKEHANDTKRQHHEHAASMGTMTGPLSRTYDGSMPIDIWKWMRARELKIQAANESSLLKLKDGEGRNLYRVTDGGSILRTKPLSKSTRRKVIERDQCCVQCGAGAPFEVDHIIRYADGGSNLPDNLQTLCVPCHRRKGGR